MAKDSRVEAALRGVVGERVRTDRVERKLYSADIGTMPPLIAPFVPAGIAGAVVRPMTEDEVVDLVLLAQSEHLSLVPRGASTSGYGGVLPRKDAVVVDLSGMSGIVSVDVDGMTVTVKPGTIWEQLARDLSLQDLDLRLYPSSAPSSTVAGWLAQGGAGFGSYEYGTFADNVVSARVVLPNGTVRRFAGNELSLVADAEGITGIITEITLRVRALEAESHLLVAFNNAPDLASAIRDLNAACVPLWSVTFLNPESIKLKRQLPHRHGHPYEEAAKHEDPELPDAHLLLLAYPTSRAVDVEKAVQSAAEQRRGRVLDAEAAEHEWDLRFAPMRLKRIGPSIVPAEVVVPLDSLANVLDEIDDKVEQPFVIEGMVMRGEKVVLLGFIPHDERTFAFNLAFALSLTVLRIAKRYGGAAYSTGLYFRGEASNVLGKERVRELAAYKKQVDPSTVMNPGKVLGRGFLDALMGIAQWFEPAVRPFANMAKAKTGDRSDVSKTCNGVPGHVAFMAQACARCGYCVPTCEQYMGRGWESHSPRGKYAFIREVVAGREKFDQDMVDKFLMCTTCEMCNNRCQLGLPVEHDWMTMRGVLINDQKKMTFPPFEMIAASLRGEKNIWAGKREKRADWMPEDLKPKIKEKADILYFAGCTASFVNTDVAEASVRILDEAGIDFAYMGTDEACCGIPMKMSGKWDVFEEIFEYNVREAKKRGAKTIVTSCPACGLVWKEMYAELARKKGIDYPFEIKHYSEVAAEAIADGRLKFEHEVNAKIAFHDSCHMGRAQGNYEPPREMLKAIPGVELVEMEHNREEGLCCGSVVTLIGEAPVGPVLGGMRLQEALDVEADTCVALCPCCQVQLRDSARKNGMDIKVDDLARVVAQGLGYEIEGSSDVSLEMWGYFEKFIYLMKPESMADLMAALFPQMMAAMPLGMAPMMRAMRRVPGGYAMMKRMMPIMFPMLVPGIMPKVMPDMLAEVSRRVGPLPEDMEALMPDLLPQTMDALMPNLLPQLIPLIVPKMIDCMRSGRCFQPANA